MEQKKLLLENTNGNTIDELVNTIKNIICLLIIAI